jgi:hypothetical protein
VGVGLVVIDAVAVRDVEALLEVERDRLLDGGGEFDGVWLGESDGLWNLLKPSVPILLRLP